MNKKLILATVLVALIIHQGYGTDEEASDCGPDETLVRGRCCTVEEMETEPECFPQERDPDEDRPDGDIDQRECFEALAQLGLDEDSMAISSCADCLELAIEVPEGDVPDLGDPADVESVIDREALGRCACGLQCATVFREYLRVIEESCTGVLNPPQIFAATIDILDDTCGDVAEDWPEDDPCAPRRQDNAAEGGTQVCMIHNDPHVIGFGVSVQDQQTCNQTGTFTVLDNQYFSIIAEAEPIPSVQGLPWLGASIVTSVTFEYKNSSCSMFNGAASKTYQAADMTQTRIQTIRDPRLWTTVTLRKRTMARGEVPFFIVNIRTPYHEGSGVCVDGCATEDSVNLQEFLGSRRRLLDMTQAEEQCEQDDLEEAFVNTCIFDSVGTDDVDTFSESTRESSTSYSEFISAAEEENKEFESSATENGGPSPDNSARITNLTSGMLLGTLMVFMGVTLAHA